MNTQDRIAFEAWYCADAAQHGLSNITPEHMVCLRDGDGYGDHRLTLNSKWQCWQAAALSARAAYLENLEHEIVVSISRPDPVVQLTRLAHAALQVFIEECETQGWHVVRSDTGSVVQGPQAVVAEPSWPFHTEHHE